MDWAILICTLITTFLSVGMTASQVADQVVGENVKSDKIIPLVNGINSILTKSTSRDALLNALNTRNSSALQAVLYSNPVSGRGLDSILKDTNTISALMMERESLKQKLANIQNSIGNLNVTAFWKKDDNIEEIEKLEAEKEQVESAMAANDRKVDQLSSNGNKVKTITTNQAINQNVKGGLK